jgi:arsenate reductase
VKGLTIYTLSNCSTCRDATKWLRARGVAFAEKPIRETPPTLAELKTVLAAYDGKVTRLFNTSGLDYRALGMAEKLPGLGTDEALQVLAGNGRLVKRPFLVGSGVALVGFDAKAWAEALPKK